MLRRVVGSSESVRGLAALSMLPVELPPGRLIHGDEGADDQPVLWVSDRPAGADLWAALRQAHRHTGLWPLLLDSLDDDNRRPWDDGELWPTTMTHPSDFDPEELLAQWWSDYTTIDEDDALPAPERLAVTAPYRQHWPGLAAPIPVERDPGAHAERSAAALLAGRPWLRLGLVPTDRPSDAITVAGWQGAANYTNDTAELSAVLRSWKKRFGVTVIGAGFAELYVSVAAPPTTAAQATSVAAEHFAFCPDNIWQGGPSSLAGYADQLVNAPAWNFWWD